MCVPWQDIWQWLDLKEDVESCKQQFQEYLDLRTTGYFKPSLDKSHVGKLHSPCNFHHPGQWLANFKTPLGKVHLKRSHLTRKNITTSIGPVFLDLLAVSGAKRTANRPASTSRWSLKKKDIKQRFKCNYSIQYLPIWKGHEYNRQNHCYHTILTP